MSSPLRPECRKTLSSVSVYLDGELDPTACETIERHCRACADCAAIVAGLQETVGLCRQIGARSLPLAVLERARTSLRRLLEATPTEKEEPRRAK
jgi:anti-sigma factor RsiW